MKLHILLKYHHILNEFEVHPCYPHICFASVIFDNFCAVLDVLPCVRIFFIFHLIFMKLHSLVKYHHILIEFWVHPCDPHICSASVIFVNFCTFWVFKLVCLYLFIFLPIFMKLNNVVIKYNHILIEVRVHPWDPHICSASVIFVNFCTILGI